MMSVIEYLSLKIGTVTPCLLKPVFSAKAKYKLCSFILHLFFSPHQEKDKNNHCTANI